MANQNNYLENKKETPFSLGTFAKNMAIGMAVFAGVEAVINVASRGAVAKIAPNLPKFTADIIRLGKKAESVGSIGASLAKKMNITIGDTIAPSIGEIISSKVENIFKTNLGPAFSDFLKYENVFSTKKYKDLTSFMDTARSYFRPEGATTSGVSRFIAGTTIRAVRASLELPMFYAIDRMFGKAYGADVNKEKQDEFSSFLKYSADSLPGFVMFKSLGPVRHGLKYSFNAASRRLYPAMEPLIGKATEFRSYFRATESLFSEVVAPNLRNIRKSIYDEIHKESNEISAQRVVKGVIQGTRKLIKAFPINSLTRETYNRYLEKARNKDLDDLQDPYFAILSKLHEQGILRKQPKTAENFIKTLSSKQIEERSHYTSWLGYIAGHHESTTYSFKLNDLVAKKISNLESFAKESRKPIQIELEKWKAIRNLISNNNIGNLEVSLNNVMAKRTFVDLNKISGREFVKSAANRLQNVAIRIPFSDFSFANGSYTNNKIPIFKLLGMDFLAYRSEPIGNIKFGNLKGTTNIQWVDKLPSGEWATTRTLARKEIGGMIYDRPFIYNMKTNTFEWAPHEQRYRNIENTVFMRAWKTLQAKTTDIINKSKEVDINIQRKYFYKNIVNVSKKSGKSIEEILSGNEEIYNKLGLADYLKMSAERVINKISATYELGPYGSGSPSKISILTKFFNPDSNYNIMEKHGLAGNIESLLSNLNDDALQKFRENPLAGSYFLNKLQKYYSKSMQILETTSRNMVMRTDYNEISAALAKEKQLNSSLNNFTYLKKSLESIMDDKKGILRDVSDETKRLIELSYNAINSKQDIASLAAKKIDDIYGRSMTELELIQRTILLTKGIQQALGRTESNNIISFMDRMLQKSSIKTFDSAKHFNHLGANTNPFRAMIDYSKLEKEFNILKRKNVEVDIAGFDNILTDFFNEATREKIKTNYSYISDLLKDNGKIKNDILNTFNRYSDDLARAHRIQRGPFMGIFKSEYANKFDKYIFTKEDIINKNTYLLYSFNKEELKDMPAQLQKNMFSYVTNYFFAERLNRVAGSAGINMEQHETIVDAARAFGMKRMLPLVLGLGIWQTADAITDTLNIGSFDEGLTVAAAEKVMQLQNITSKLRDNLGITPAAKYLEGLMPGFINSPAAKFLRTAGTAFGGAYLGTIAGNPALGALLGIGTSAFQDFGLSDLTKTNDENKDIWTGKKMVPIRSGANWLLSKGFFGGDRISGWAPHWFARMKSQAEYSNVLYGSKLESLIYKPWPLLGINPIGFFIDPYHYEKVNYFNRPYLYTAAPGEELPFVGPFAAIGGSVLKPIKVMHTEPQAESYSDSNNQEFINEQMRIKIAAENALIFGNLPQSATGGESGNVAAPYSPLATTIEALNTAVYQPLGIYGFLGKTAMSGMFGNSPLGVDYIAESAGRMTSTSREYWSLGLGDQLMTNEFLRRMIPEKKEGFNNIPNTMTWLPGSDYKINFREGDPYTKIILGEYRLPGAGYERLHRVKRTFPITASMAGYDPITMAQVIAGLAQEENDDLQEIADEGTKIHRLYQEMFISEGKAKQVEKFLYDPISDISGFADIIGSMGEIIEIKTTTSSQLKDLNYAKEKHRAQVNVYMKAAGAKFGRIIYVARDNPALTKDFVIAPDPKLYLKTIRTAATARMIAASLPENILAPGAGYSHLDRFKILADVAPYSKQYFQEKTILDEQARLGNLSNEEYFQYYESIKMAEAQMRPTDLYPNRFYGVSPDQEIYGITEQNEEMKKKADLIRRGIPTDADYEVIRKGLDMEYNMFNINSNIKDAAAYSPVERLIGAGYEALLKVQVPYVSRKFMQYWTPMEAYKRNVLQGSKDSFWNNPAESFFNPMIDQTLAATNPIQGFIQGGMIGSIAGGAPGMFAGGIAGSIYGTARGIGEAIGAVNPYVKPEIEGLRNIERYIDDLKAVSARQEYERTGNLEAFREYQKTLEGSANAQNKFIGTFAGLPQVEKPYVSLIAQTRNEQMINELANYLPEQNAMRLQEYVGNVENEFTVNSYNNPYKNTYTGPTIDWNVVNDDEYMDKLKYRVISDAGYNARLSGLGWKKQLVQYEQTRNIFDYRNPLFKKQTQDTYSEMTIRDIIYKAMRETGCIGIINVSNNGSETIEVEIR